MTILKRADSTQLHVRKKVHRIAAVLYLLALAVVVGMTYLSEQQKLAAKQTSPSSSGAEQIVANDSNLVR